MNDNGRAVLAGMKCSPCATLFEDLVFLDSVKHWATQTNLAAFAWCEKASYAGKERRLAKASNCRVWL